MSVISHIQVSTAILTLWAGVLFADGRVAPSISECGAISKGRALPRYHLKLVRLPKLVTTTNGAYECEIKLVLDGQQEVVIMQTLGFRSFEAESLPHKDGSTDYVAGNEVVLGWLAGATNLLLASWLDLSASYGTGHYVTQWYVIVEFKAGASSVLLRRSVLAEGRPREACYEYGTGAHFFSFDPVKHELLDRMQFSRDLVIGSGVYIPPLYYEATEGCEAATHMYIANINETILHRYRLRQGKLETAGIEMYYKTQRADSLANVAKFYFGPLTPASVTTNANRDLAARFGDVMPPGTLVRIPLPPDWITKFYE